MEAGAQVSCNRYSSNYKAIMSNSYKQQLQSDHEQQLQAAKTTNQQ
jgi:hypothetical protein